MVSPVITEQFYTGAFLVREANGNLSRDVGVITNSTGADVLVEGGTVMSRATLGAPTVTAGTNTGNGTLGSITLPAGAKLGNYVVTAISATVFSVIDPSGVEMQNATVGTAYAESEIGFTITAGGTAFVAGDKFTIAVPAGTGAMVNYTGPAPAVAILFNRVWVPANSSKTVTLITRMAEVNSAELQWDPSVTSSGSMAALQAAALASLAALGIVAR